MTYSFDIFDTCLIRNCGRPDVVFELLAEKILGQDADDSQILDFVLIRKKGEQQASSQIYSVSGKEEITLDEIYQNCDFSSLTSVKNDEIKNTELLIEEENLCPVFELKNKISQLRNEGNKIIFISDMYLSQSFILRVLTRNGLFEEGDLLYVSSEYGVRKSSGKLYQLIQQREQIDTKNWIHFGDNEGSDIIVPRKFGIKAKRVIHKYSYYENEFRKNPPFSSRTYLSLCASFSKAIRLTTKPSPALCFAADFIAPLYVSFVSWVLQDASKRGISKLYFLARDGQIFYKIAEKFHDIFPEISIHYLYVSRKSLYLPGLDEISVSQVERLVLGKKLLNVLDCFQMEDTIEKFKKYEHLCGHELIETLLSDPLFVSILQQRRNRQKELLLQYLIQEGLHEGTTAVVDLNGSRNGQTIISRVLRQSGYSGVFGYFFAPGNNRIPGTDYKAMFFHNLQDNGNRQVCALPPVMMLEEYFSLANHSTTISYQMSEQGVIPVLGQDTIDKSTKLHISDMNVNICQQFATMYVKWIPSKISQLLCYHALSVVTNFVNAPSYYYLQVFKGLTFSWTSVLKVKMLSEGTLLDLLRNRHSSPWFLGELVNRFPLHNFATLLLRIVLLIRKHANK